MPKKSSNSEELPSALIKFDSLPDAANVRQPVVEALFACSSATLWRRCKDGSIPAPKRLSPRITTWNVGALREFLRMKGALAANVPVSLMDDRQMSKARRDKALEPVRELLKDPSDFMAFVLGFAMAIDFAEIEFKRDEENMIVKLRARLAQIKAETI